MTQETELEVDVLMQLQGSGSKRGGNYHHDEDIQLCRSWINITTDPITANDQPSKSYWARIAEHFHDHKCFESDRTTASLEKRVSSMDESQRAYVRVMRAQIAAAKVASLNSGASEHASGAAGDDVSSA